MIHHVCKKTCNEHPLFCDCTIETYVYSIMNQMVFRTLMWTLFNFLRNILGLATVLKLSVIKICGTVFFVQALCGKTYYQHTTHFCIFNLFITVTRMEKQNVGQLTYLTESLTLLWNTCDVHSWVIFKIHYKTK